MAYDRYATQFTDKDGNVYGVMDEESRSHLALVEGGYNPDMIVGGAEHLVSKDGVVDTTLYGLRRVPDGAGQAYLEKVVGGTVAWNQFVPDEARQNTSKGVTYTRAEKAPYVLSGTATDGNAIFPLSPINYLAQVGHKYLFYGGIDTSIYLSLSTVSIWGAVNPNDQGHGKIANAVSEGEFNLVLLVMNGTAADGKKVIPQLFDLTQMFGPTIADAIYAMEQATAGAGVAWFRKLFPASYYAYNAGELISVNALSHKTVGFNQWDEEWEVGNWSITDGTKGTLVDRIRCANHIPVIPNAAYYFKGSTPMRILCYDKDKNYIGLISGDNWHQNQVLTIPNGCQFITFNTGTGTGTTYNHDICISLSSDRNGKYEPYSAHTYPFSDLTLRGIPKLSGGELAYDGDTYLPDGTVTRRFGVVDLGTLSWVYTSGDHSRFNSTFASVKPTGDASVVALCVCSKYTADSVANIYVHSKDKTIGVHNSDHQLWIYDSAYSDAAAFKAAMSGVYLVYELATPTTEQADPFNPFQILDPYGTEEFISGTIVPVGHSTRYQADMVKTMRKEIDAALICPTASGAIASFPDGADGLKLRELNVAVEPVQDLHGYDAPWPGGGGKNKCFRRDSSLPAQWSGITVVADGAEGIKINGTASAAIGFDTHEAKLESGKTYTLSVDNVSTLFNGFYVNYMKYSGDTIIGTVMGPRAGVQSVQIVCDGTFDAIRVRPTVDSGKTVNNAVLKFKVEEGSTVTTWTPYSNICPISGHTGAVVTRTGKNLLHKLVSGTVFGVTMTANPDGSVSFSGTVTSNDAIYYASNSWITLPAGTYILSGGIGYGLVIRVGKDALGGTYVTQAADTPATFTLTEETAIRIGLRVQYKNGQSVSGTFYPMIRLASETDGAYEPYQSISVTIPFGQTVYGGNLTLHQDGSGELVVDRAIVDLGNCSWELLSANSMFHTTITGLKPTPPKKFVCTNYPTADVWPGQSGYDDVDCVIIVLGNDSRVRIKDTRYSDTAAFKTAMSGVMLVYELATPVTISLSASQITTLLGHNNIFADCGDVSVTYPADTKLYIDGQQTEDDMTADTNIPNGYYFQIGNTLYKATAAIAQGETIIPGTNCTRTTFAEALNLLAAQ